MDLQTHQSLMFDTTILENGIIKIPELTNWQQQDVHIVVVLKEQIQLLNANIIDNKKEKQLEQLLAVSTWNDNDIEEILESQKFTNQWRIEEF